MKNLARPVSALRRSGFPTGVPRAAGDTTGVGATVIAQIDRTAGTVTNIVITCPGVNYTATPTFTMSGVGATFVRSRP